MRNPSDKELRRLYAWAATQPWMVRPDFALAMIAEILPPSTEVVLDGREIQLINTDPGTEPLWPTQEARMIGPKRDIAYIPVTGPIMRHANLMTMLCGGATTQQIAEDVANAVKDPAVHAIVMEYDSPGGHANGISELAQMIRAASLVKPLVAYVSGDACSAAYWLATAAGRVYTSDTGVLGSIGTVALVPNPAFETGIPPRIEMVSTQSPKKRLDLGTAEGKSEFQGYLDAMTDVFMSGVASMMGVSLEKVATDFGQGGLFLGAQAVKQGMAHEVSTLDQVVEQLSASPKPGVNHASVNKGRKVRMDASPLVQEDAVAKEDETPVQTAPEAPETPRFSLKEVFTAIFGNGPVDPLFAANLTPAQVEQPEQRAIEPVVTNPASAQKDEEPVATTPQQALSPEIEALRLEHQAQMAEMTTQLEQANQLIAEQRRTTIEQNALSFVKEEVMAGRMTPAEQEDYKLAYTQAQVDDDKLGAIELSEGVQTTRVQQLKKRQALRSGKPMTMELVQVLDAETPLENNVETPREDDEAPMTPEKRRSMLQATSIGRAALAKEDAAARAR